MQHIIDIFSSQGFSDFILATGYKSSMILGHFLDSGMKYDGKLGDDMSFFSDKDKNIAIVNTGLETMTGGRLKRLEPYLKEPFIMTYGDGLANVNMQEVIKTFAKNDSLVTVTAVHPEGRFGSVHMAGDKVVDFGEKIDTQDWINGGFMVIDPAALQYICNGDVTNWEKDSLPIIAHEGRMSAYRHIDFWACLDTLRDKEALEKQYSEQGSKWLTMART